MKSSVSSVFAIALGLAALLSASFASAQGTLTCSPARQTVNVNQQVTLTATGGTGAYTWATANGVSPNSGSSFSITPTSPEITTVIVSSGGQQAVCVLDVVGAGGYRQPTFDVSGGGTVGVPNTGAGTSALALIAVVLLASFFAVVLFFFGRRMLVSVIR